MHLSVSLGFTRLYPFAFSYFAVSLNQRAIHTNDTSLATEAQRFGMIGAKMARLSDYYGGHSVNLYHWHVAHWRRAYKRSLDPVLQCYNAQFDAGKSTKFAKIHHGQPWKILTCRIFLFSYFQEIISTCP